MLSKIKIRQIIIKPAKLNMYLSVVEKTNGSESEEG